MLTQKVRRSLHAAIVGTLLVYSCVDAMALELGDRFELHGYGDFNHEMADVDATGQGLNARESTYEHALVGVWKASDRAKVWVQVFGEKSSSARVDWAFFDYQAESGLTYRVGRVRMPFGLLNEIRDVQYLRPTASLPLLYDASLNLSDESIEGGMIQHRFALGAGRATLEAYVARAARPDGDSVARGSMLGGRLMVDTPVDGLTLGVSGYQGDLSRAEDDTPLSKRGWALSARYQGDRLDLQAEYARGFLFTRDVSAWYLQAAVPLAEQWKAAVRFEEMVTDLTQGDDDAYRERRVIVGLAYSINRYLGLRLEQQFHQGYASRIVNEALEPGDGRQHWTSTVLSLNYQF